MTITERVGKWEFFKLVTGRDFWGRDGWKPKTIGDTPNFEIPEDRIDEVYLAAKKMLRCYYPDDGRSNCRYYGELIAKVEDAYLLKDIEGFREAIEDLVTGISAD